MSAPPGEGQYAQGEQPQQDFSQGAPDAAPAAGKKKKRGYAAGAFDVGAGANAAVGGQLQGGGQQYAGAPSPAYGGYPQQPEAQQQAAPGYPQYGQGFDAQQQPAGQQPAYGSYSASDQGYAGVGTQPGPGAPGVGGITQGMGGMNLGGQPPAQPGYQGAAQQPLQQHQGTPASAPRVPLNQLYPTDLMNQPFSVSELDLPPPPIIVPPNVSLTQL